MNPFVDTLHVTLQRSTLLTTVSALAHGVALLAALVLTWQVLWGMTVVLVVAGSAAYSLCIAVPAGFAADRRLRWTADDYLYWVDAQGRQQKAECVDAQLFGTLLVRLSLAASGSAWQRRALLIPFDAVDIEIHRRLRARAQLRGRGRRSAALD